MRVLMEKMQISTATDSCRPKAGAAIFDLPHPNRPFKQGFLSQLSGDDFINPSTRQWPVAVVDERQLNGCLDFLSETA